MGHGRWPRKLLGIGGLVAALASCDASQQDGDAGSRDVLDERALSFRSVRLGATSARIRTEFGPPLKSPDGRVTPPDVDYYDVGGPTSFAAPPSLRGARTGGSLRYRDTAWIVEAGRAFGVMTVAPNARTRAGVGIGDPQSKVRERFGDAECLEANEGSEYVTFPLCEVVLRPGVRLYFGGRPVKSLWLIVSGDRAFKDLLKRQP